MQNSPYFRVNSSTHEQSNKSLENEAENGERDWGDTLKIRKYAFFLSPHTSYGRVRLARFACTTLTPSFTDFEKKPDCFAV